MTKKNLDPILKWEGNSFLINLMAVVVNLVGLTLVVMGNHQAFEATSSSLNIVGVLLMLASIAGLIIFKGRMMMSAFSRVLVGGLFIVSGLVKANDPLGFSYKLEEYFEEGALAFRIKEWFSAPEFSLEFFIQWALPLSILICVLEIVLGVLLILGQSKKIVSVLILGMMVFFTFLTWHTANCDGTMKFKDRDRYAVGEAAAEMKVNAAAESDEITVVQKTADFVLIDEMKQPQCVDDCGCFGDALKGSVGRSLTPAESMWKDLVLVYFSIWLVLAAFRRGRFQLGNLSRYILSSMFIILLLSWIFGWYFPLVFALGAILGSAWLINSSVKWMNNSVGASIWVVVLCSLMVGYVLAYAPIKDYRPYAVGSNLVERMNDGVNQVSINYLDYKNKKTGEVRSFVSTTDTIVLDNGEQIFDTYNSSMIWENKDFELDTNYQKVIIPFQLPSITEQFNPYLAIDQLGEEEKALQPIQQILSENKMKVYRLHEITNNYDLDVPVEEYLAEDYPEEYYTMMDTLEVLNPELTEVSLREFLVTTPRVYVLLSKSLADANWSKMDKYKEIHAFCKRNNIPMVVLSSSSRTEMNAFRKENNWSIPMFINDETEMKAISRSNPALMIIENGIVKAKFAHRSTPSVEWIEKNLEN